MPWGAHPSLESLVWQSRQFLGLEELRKKKKKQITNFCRLSKDSLYNTGADMSQQLEERPQTSFQERSLPLKHDARKKEGCPPLLGPSASLPSCHQWDHHLRLSQVCLLLEVSMSTLHLEKETMTSKTTCLRSQISIPGSPQGQQGSQQWLNKIQRWPTHEVSWHPTWVFFGLEDPSTPNWQTQNKFRSQIV